MCGIFGFIGKKTNAAKIVFEGLKSLEYRGYDSWGIAVVPTSPKSEKTKIVIKKRAGKIGEARVDDLPASSFAFGHTRWATHGGISAKNAHPHLDCTGQTALIHNGIIENYQEIKEKLRGKHRFVSETDTEVAVHLIEEYLANLPFGKAVQKAFNQLKGSNAIIAINTKTQEMVAVRNGSPLVIGLGGRENLIASDAAALLPHTKRVHFLEDNQIAVITPAGVTIADVKTSKPVKLKQQRLNWTLAQVTVGKYPNFMAKEIHQQPSLIAQIAKRTPEAENLARLIKKSFGTYLVGCGSAGYAALAGSYLFSKIAKLGINWAVGSEFGYQLDFLTRKSLVITLSQSGETMDILESIKKAKARGATIAALVNVLGSTLYRQAHHKILIGAGPEKSVASTKALTAKLAHLILLAYALAGRKQLGQKLVSSAAQAAQKILDKPVSHKIQKLAKLLKHQEHLYIVGRGLSYPASLETAMKIKEISYIHAEGLATGELKHGTLALVEKDTPCISFLPNDETYEASLAGTMEIKARGGFIIGVSWKPAEIFDYFIPVADVGEATIIPNIIVGQTLAYYLTMERGLDPDKPRNLAKSVTVK